jgi:uncharacterized protein (DUF305 family)
MNKKSLLFGISGLIIGIAVTWVISVATVNGNHTDMMKMMGMDTKSNSSQTAMSDGDMSMSQMMNSLQGKTGDDFDKTFITEMIAHHQGAIDMANLAKTNAKHDEIKNTANDIVAAQTKEIKQLKTWQMDWGYTSSSSSHDIMNMSH